MVYIYIINNISITGYVQIDYNYAVHNVLNPFTTIHTECISGVECLQKDSLATET